MAPKSFFDTLHGLQLRKKKMEKTKEKEDGEFEISSIYIIMWSIGMLLTLRVLSYLRKIVGYVMCHKMFITSESAFRSSNLIYL